MLYCPEPQPLSNAADDAANGDIQRCPGITIWFTGLSGSGKTTLAPHLEALLRDRGIHAARLDGDCLRKGLNESLDFSTAGRAEGIRRAAHVARLFNANGLTVLAALISPMEHDREVARSIIGTDNFFLVYTSTPLSTCEFRDTKGLYRKARAGEIQQFTGITSPYEQPLNADISIDTSCISIDDSLALLISAINARFTNQTHALQHSPCTKNRSASV